MGVFQRCVETTNQYLFMWTQIEYKQMLRHSLDNPGQPHLFMRKKPAANFSTVGHHDFLDLEKYPRKTHTCPQKGTIFFKKKNYSWWFQPIWKLLVKMGIFPK